MIGLCISFSSVTIGLLALSASFINMYSQYGESCKLTKSIGTLALFTSLITLFILPVDLYIISSSTSDTTGKHINASLIAQYESIVNITYFVLYSILAAFLFIFLPFGFFFYEEERENTDLITQSMSAMRYTLAFVFILCVLLTLGFVLKQGKVDESVSWINAITKDFSAADDALSFVVGVISVIGMLGWMSYTAFGLAWLPLKILSVHHHVESSRNEVAQAIHNHSRNLNHDHDAARVMARIDFLQSRYASSSLDQWSSNDRRELTRLLSRHHAITRSRPNLPENIAVNSHQITSSSRRKRCLLIMQSIFLPLRILLGIMCLLFSLLIVVSLCISQLDRIINSPCGIKCGFNAEETKFFNPIDWILLRSSRVIFFDFIGFSFICAWLFVCTITGLVSLGIRAFCIKLYYFRKHGTMQNALLMGVWILSFVLLAINIQMRTLAPQYTMFGNQRYIPHNQTVLVPCIMSLANIDQNCIASQLSRFQLSISARLPLLGNIFFFSNLIFVFVFFITLLVGLFRTHQNSSDEFSRLEDETVEDERLDYFMS